MTTYNEKTKKRYDKRLKNFGYNPKTLGWIKGKQSLRFQILTSIGKLDNSSVLDLGCGFGDLYGFLKYCNIKCSYLGLELNPNIIDIGKKKYPKAELDIFDVEKNDIPRKFDWIIISGMFNFKRKRNYEFIENVLKKAFNSCKKGIAVDFLSAYVDFRNNDASYVSPEKIFKIGKKLSKRVIIRHDYMPFEFCSFIYKNQIITKDNSFKEAKMKLEPELRSNKWLKYA